MPPASIRATNFFTRPAPFAGPGAKAWVKFGGRMELGWSWGWAPAEPAAAAEAAGERAWVPAFTYLKLRVESLGAVGRLDTFF